MTPAQLRLACTMAGGVSALARMIGVSRTTLHRRLAPMEGRDEPQPVSLTEELAILKALGLESVERLMDPSSPASPSPRESR